MRLTRNQFPFGSVGSNPTSCVSFFSHQFLDSLVVRISACHVEGPGSIPGRGGNFLASLQPDEHCVAFYHGLPASTSPGSSVGRALGF